MSTALRVTLLCAMLVVAANGFAQLNIVNFDFGAVPVMCGGGIGIGYQGPVYRCAWPDPFQNFNASPGFGWTMNLGAGAAGTGKSGLTLPNTTFEPPPFTGLPFTQAAFLQDHGGTVSQSIAGFTIGSYTLGFYLGSRYYSGPWDGNQTVEALIDGNVVGTWVLSSYTPFTWQTASFTVSTSGSHTLTFKGLNPGDHTAFFSYVTITPTER
ncbi:MAG: hypothetical protein WCC25_08590 [Candidatus Korobacteraceae bacterium]